MAENLHDIIRVEHLTKKFGKLTVLNDISISFKQHEVVSEETAQCLIMQVEQGRDHKERNRQIQIDHQRIGEETVRTLIGSFRFAKHIGTM